MRSSRALVTLAWGAVAVGVAAPLVRHRLRLRAPVVTALSFQAPVALALATPRTRVRDAGIYALQMWAYYAHYDMPDDDPEDLLARTRVDYPTRVDRGWAAGACPPTASSARWAGPGRSAATTWRCRGCTGAGSSCPTARSATCCCATTTTFLRSAMLMAATFDLGLVVYWACPRRRPGTRRRAAGWRRCGGSWSRPASGSGKASGGRFTIDSKATPSLPCHPSTSVHP